MPLPRTFPFRITPLIRSMKKRIHTLETRSTKQQESISSLGGVCGGLLMGVLFACTRTHKK